MYTWNYKPNEYGKITAASIQELKEKTNALVCSSVNSTYCITHHYGTSYSGNSTKYAGDYSTNKTSQLSEYNKSHDGSDYNGYLSSVNTAVYGTQNYKESTNVCTGHNNTN